MSNEPKPKNPKKTKATTPQTLFWHGSFDSGNHLCFVTAGQGLSAFTFGILALAEGMQNYYLGIYAYILSYWCVMGFFSVCCFFSGAMYYYELYIMKTSTGKAKMRPTFRHNLETYLGPTAGIVFYIIIATGFVHWSDDQGGLFYANPDPSTYLVATDQAEQAAILKAFMQFNFLMILQAVTGFISACLSFRSILAHFNPEAIEPDEKDM